MVAPITLNVRHIRGHTFTVEVDHDADVLGLKVIIWENEHIPIDQQRLVFGGKELEDGVKLSGKGISDGAQIFLVESNDALGNGDEAEIVYANDGEIQASAVVAPAFNDKESGSFMVSMAQPDARDGNNNYELVSDSQASNERVSGAIALAKYVRVYCIFAFILSLIATFECVWSGIPALVFLVGWVGTRQLNRCLLAFPLIMTGLIGFGGMGTLIYHAIKYEFEGACPWIVFTFFLLICLFHVMICLSIVQLGGRIGKLSCDEVCNAKAKIARRGCCC